MLTETIAEIHSKVTLTKEGVKWNTDATINHNNRIVKCLELLKKGGG